MKNPTIKRNSVLHRKPPFVRANHTAGRATRSLTSSNIPIQVCLQISTPNTFHQVEEATFPMLIPLLRYLSSRISYAKALHIHDNTMEISCYTKACIIKFPYVSFEFMQLIARTLVRLHTRAYVQFILRLSNARHLKMHDEYMMNAIQ